MLLASHDAARGMYAQAWNLSSTAIAMMMGRYLRCFVPTILTNLCIDLGCHLDRPSSSSDRNDLQREQAVKRQMRTRIFWSSFIWDKQVIRNA